VPYYYSVASQQTSNSSANTDTFLANIHGSAAGQRAALQKLQAGSYITPADNAVRLRVHRTSVLLTPGTTYTPNPVLADAPSAATVATTLPTGGTLVANPVLQLAFNQRGTGLWAAFTLDEAVGVVGSSAPNSEIVLDSQSTGTSVAVNFKLIFSE
jgi:hypothetical protein